ncbi:O-antigen ligase [Kordia sp. SMS9]|uniref:O-antigen ligase family protein n=1 Tax=Kordia sp. SMS9 TaxID=2282170 RepID=UPI000E0DFC07|nr:O-antigen ligase family protein [Kordia sp. SMS9]AXG71338.1 O-antigen ligase [Kordia sp. SMS9]
MATRVAYMEKRIEELGKSNFLKFTMLAVLFSYFYNLAVFNYSITGNNELRLYDFLGLLILFLSFQYKSVLLWFIQQQKFTNYLWIFMKWCMFMMIFTFFISYLNGRLTWILRTTLFMYHFLTFYFSSLFFLILMRNVKILRFFIYAHIILIIVATVIVLMQHFGAVAYLWSELDRRAYGGFLSGILGPNKIVLGMVTMISAITFVGLFLQKGLRINKILLIAGIVFALIGLGLSGSRTSYLGILVFLLYLAVRSTGKFIYISIVMGIVIFGLVSYDSEIFSMVTNVFEGRVVNKISDPSLIAEGDVDQLYEDLGSGRKNLSLRYIDYLLENVYVVPFGSGFNNFILVGYSAHNIYLTLINEVGLLGLFFYVRWLLSYFAIRFIRFKFLGISLRGLVFAMMVTLLFGEQLYVYRPVFAILGLFLFATATLLSPRYYKKI